MGTQEWSEVATHNSIATCEGETGSANPHVTLSMRGRAETVTPEVSATTHRASNWREPHVTLSMNGSTNGTGAAQHSDNNNATNPSVTPQIDANKWMEHVPRRLRERLDWRTSYNIPIPDNALVLLFVGDDDAGALDKVLLGLDWTLVERIVVLDWKRCERTQDFLKDEPWFSLCTAASEGRLMFIGGGPMCRTWSVRRLIRRFGGGLPCRGREPPWCWGLPELLEEDRALDRLKTDNDSVLLLRQLLLIVLAYNSGSLKGAFLEHPEDPAKCSWIEGAEDCASIWAIEWIREILDAMGTKYISFDQ